MIRDQLQSLFVLINNIASLTAAQVDGVSTLPPGSPAGVSVSGNTLHFSFELPQGQDGPSGPPGPPGEVTTAEMANAIQLAIQGTSTNSNGVNTMSLSADGSYNSAQMQQLADKVDELILALRR